jgi:hypothetical protein
VHGQTGERVDHLARADVPPAEERVFDDGPGVPVHPAAGGHADAEGYAAGVVREQGAEPGGGVGEDVPLLLPLPLPVVQAAFGDDTAAQVQEGDGRVRHRHVHAADHEPGVVQVDRYVGAADSVRPPECRRPPGSGRVR